MSEIATTVNLPAMARKGWERGGDTTVVVAGVTGTGRTRKAACDDAATAVLDTLHNMSARAAFVRDADGSLWVFVPEGTGTGEYRVTADDRVSSGGWNEHTPHDAAETIVKNHVGSVRLQ